jgi:SAM-dependent methyltransferase
MEFRDHFSHVAAAYARFRPDYPAALLDWLAGVAPGRGSAWDCACGSGQATVPLAARFERVVATDASLEQLSKAPTTDNVSMAASLAETAPLPDHSVDLVTVAQAIHWFDLEAFFAEVRRVLVPGGVVAAWTYGLPEVEDEAVRAVVDGFIADTLGPFWPPEVAHVLDGYVSLDFPFTEIEPPHLEMTVSWTLPRFLAFVRTWSGVGRYIEARGDDPVRGLEADLVPRWGPAARQRSIRWSVNIRAGIV